MVTGVTPVTIRIVTCAGDPRARGRIQGEELREAIATGLDRWRDALATAHGLDPDDYIHEFLDNTSHLPAIQRWTPGLLEEARGIAEGAGQHFARILAYSLLDEEWSYSTARRRGTPGCTVACFRRQHDGTPVIGQTMDIPAVHDGTQAVIRHLPEDGPATLVFTAAGMLGLMGVNAAGVGVVVNNLGMLQGSPAGLPVMFVLRGLLARSTLAEACDFVQRVPHAVGQHYAIGGPDGLASFECAANGAVRDATAVERILHTNHPLVNDAIVGNPEPAYAASNTRARYAHLLATMPAVTDVAGVERVLADTTVPVSCAPRRGFMTFGAMTAELSEPPRARFAAGPPHLTPFVDVGFATTDGTDEEDQPRG